MSRVEYQKKVIDLGLPIFPLHGKKPPKGFHWKDQAALHPVPTESYGIACEQRIAVIDADTRERAVWWWQNMTRTPWLVRTPSGGVHFIYASHPEARNAQKIDGAIDVRADGGYIVGVGSRVKGKMYELIGEITLDLPQFNPEWMPDRTRLHVTAQRAEIRNVMKYVMQIESVQGEGGSKGLVRAAAVCRDNEMSEAEAVVLLLKWNQTDKVQPSWSPEEIARAITRVYQKSK